MNEVTFSLDKSKLYSILKELKDREQKVLKWRYGLTNEERLTQKEVARRLGISRSYVSRIEKRVINKIGKIIGN